MMDRTEIEEVASEFVLGTLPDEQRAAASTARLTDGELDAAIYAWELRLAALNEATPEATPSVNHFQRIMDCIDTRNGRPSLRPAWRNLNISHPFVPALILVLVMLAGMFVYKDRQIDVTPQMVAVLQQNSGSPLFFIRLDKKTLTLNIKVLSATPPASKSYELWLITKREMTPRSLGVLPTQTDTQIHMSGVTPTEIGDVTLAVSIEPVGGSPTGAPTGPVILTSKFMEANL